MKHKNKLLAALLSGVMALSLTAGLTACDKPDNPNNDPPIITQPVAVVTLNKSTVELKVGETFTLVAEVKVAGLNVGWSTSDAAVAEVKDGVVTAKSEGTAEITAKVGNDTAKCTVTVAKASTSPSTKPVITEDEWYEGGLYINNNVDPDDVDLTEGLMAEDKDGNALDVTVADDGGFSLKGVGNYTVKYEAVDADGEKGEFARTVYVTYFGVEKDFIDNKSVSSLTNWDYVGDTEEEKTASEWTKVVVPGHGRDWNRFEITPTEIIMHGSDTFGRAGTDGVNIETEDEDPNTILWNKVKVPESKSVLRIFAGNNPYPDYNNLLSKFRVSVLHLDDYSNEVAFDYVEIKAPLNATGGGLNYERIRSNYVDVDLSAYAGRTVIVLIEQDSATEVYQEDYYRDIGYEDFQIDGLIMETRDTLVVYGMRFIAGEEKIDYDELELELDESTVWGTSDSDAGSWGLRGDIASKLRWRTLSLNGATVTVLHQEEAGGGLQIIAREGSNDGAAILRDAVTLNKIKVQKRYFELYVGTDSDNVNVNFRFSVMVDGKEEHLMPVWNMPGLEPIEGSDGWSTLCRSQWVYGVKLTYDLGDYLNKEVVILLEQDQNLTDANVTLWFNRAELVSTLPELGEADYTAYNAKIADIEAAEYNEEDYTELSWMRWTQALKTFRSVPQGLNSEQQEYITRAISAIETAISSLELRRRPATDVPEDNITGTLTAPIAGFKDSDWKALEVDAYGYWGTDDKDYSYWGLRGDKGAKASWKYFTTGGDLYNDVSYGASLQSIVPENDANDTADDFVADAVFVNRVYVTDVKLVIWAGCDAVNHSVNIRVRLLLSDGSLVILNTEAAEGYNVVKNGWLQLYASQWTTGAEIVYDVSEYKGQVVTVLIEQDCDQENTQTINRTLWLNKIYFSPIRLSEEVAGFGSDDWNALKVDTNDSWGTDSATASEWGLRGDSDAKASWKYYGGTLNGATGTGSGFQSIVSGNDANDTADDFVADAVFANKVNVTNNTLVIYAGCDNTGHSINLRVRLILEDGTFVILNAQAAEGYTVVKNGWLKITASQWVYGAKIVYDVSEYKGEAVTVLIEQDIDQENTQTTNRTLWINKVYFTSYSYYQTVSGFDKGTAWEELELSEKSEWGSDDRTDAQAWGLRGDPADTGRNEWKFYTRLTENLNPETGAIILIGREDEASNNDADGIQADSLVANKTTVSGTELKINVGIANSGNSINVRVQLVFEDGSIVTLSVKNSEDGKYTALSGGWGTVTASQWVYGAEITYDISDYVGQVVTVLIEQDADQSNTEKENCVLWLLRVAYDGEEQA